MENLSREKQIEEMACAICGNNRICLGQGVNKCILHPQMRRYAENAYKEGYRKQSEGEWIRNTQTSEYICSLCGAIGPVDCLKEDFYESNYCSNCGAKMKGGTE